MIKVLAQARVKLVSHRLPGDAQAVGKLDHGKLHLGEEGTVGDRRLQGCYLFFGDLEPPQRGDVRG